MEDAVKVAELLCTFGIFLIATLTFILNLKK
jgi:hypothetical protein